MIIAHNKPIIPTSTRCALFVGILGRYKSQKNGVTYLVSLLILVLSACVNKPIIQEAVLCFESEEKAEAMGMRIFSDNFTERTRYWLDGSSEPIKGLGISWRVSDPTFFCKAGLYPIVVTYEPKDEPEFEPSLVLSKGVLSAKLLIKKYRDL
ncbi:hypothetical protein [Paraglaciecola hydrolytica]|uniref:Uncharacterized protein n=1 Tax=Paraglaciecola hydrolytica TaxID=1799789 RepID=A0A135ZZ66_9ALTE|nr:hypothetical protein [Paraglaciecola hydrolytica]KXI28247.1 hypothetical protein AX660_17880 [Paraglaciecola hydrolytica]